MRIRLHNSFGKMDRGRNYFSFLFDDKVFVRSYGNHLHLRYQIEDYDYFLSFSLDTKKFREYDGFGKNEKHFYPGWWRDRAFQWKDMGK